MRRRPMVTLSAPVVAGCVLVVASCGADRVPKPASAVDASLDHAPVLPTSGADGGTPAPEPPSDASLDVAIDVGTDADAGPSCNVRLDTPPLMDSPHVPEGTVIAYDSNPPSSGPHYPIWANFQEFTTPVPDGYLVHSMEHGAVLLLYRCASADAGASCADMAAQLRALRDAVPTDPICDPSIRVRVVLAPRPANDVDVAAAAWGNTYRADCVDLASLAKFVGDHYAKAPESSCSPGQTTF